MISLSLYSIVETIPNLGLSVRPWISSILYFAAKQKTHVGSSKFHLRRIGCDYSLTTFIEIDFCQSAMSNRQRLSY